MLSTHTGSIFSDMHRMFDRIRDEIENDFREAFRPLEEIEHRSSPLSLLPFRDFTRPALSSSTWIDPFRELREAERLVKPFLDFKPLQDIDIDKLTPPKIEDEEHTYYKMKVLTDNNGHVKTKMMEKEPGKEWQVKTEEYDRPWARAIQTEKKEEVKAIDEKKSSPTTSAQKSPGQSQKSVEQKNDKFTTPKKVLTSDKKTPPSTQSCSCKKEAK